MYDWSKVRRHTARALIALTAMGCYSWQAPKRTGPEQLIAQKHPKVVRVTVQEQMQLMLREPRVASDSLYGVVAKRSGSLRTGDSVAIHLAHITKLESQEFDGVGTTVGILGGLLAVAGVAAAVAASSINSGCTVSYNSGY
jgi:hypothetical protein